MALFRMGMLDSEHLSQSRYLFLNDPALPHYSCYVPDLQLLSLLYTIFFIVGTEHDEKWTQLDLRLWKNEGSKDLRTIKRGSTR